MEGSSQPVRMEEVDKLVNERVNEYIHNNLGQLLQAGKEIEKPTYRPVPPPPQQGQAREEKVIIVDGPLLIEDHIKAYDT